MLNKEVDLQELTLSDLYDRSSSERQFSLVNAILTQRSTSQEVDGLLVVGEGDSKTNTISTRQVLAMEAARQWSAERKISQELFITIGLISRASFDDGRGLGFLLDIPIETAIERLEDGVKGVFPRGVEERDIVTALDYFDEMKQSERLLSYFSQEARKKRIRIIQAREFLRFNFGEPGEKWSKILSGFKRKTHLLAKKGNIDLIESVAKVVGERVLSTYPLGYTAAEKRTMSKAFSKGITPNCQEASLAIQQIAGKGELIYFFNQQNGMIAPHVFYRCGDRIIPYGLNRSWEREEWEDGMKFMFELYKDKIIMEKSDFEKLGLDLEKMQGINLEII